MNYVPISIYDESAITSHPLYERNVESIKKLGLNNFLQENGVFGGIVPFYQHPELGGKLISISFEIRYRTTLKNESEWHMQFYEEREVSKDEKEATTKFLLKAFELIEHWNTNNIQLK